MPGALVYSKHSVTAELEGSAESFLYGGKYGVGVAQKESSDSRLVKPYWTKEEEIEGKDERMRSNDGAVDSQGRFWTSAMCDPQVTDIASQGKSDSSMISRDVHQGLLQEDHETDGCLG